jgi:hypothetical protein
MFIAFSRGFAWITESHPARQLPVLDVKSHMFLHVADVSLRDEGGRFKGPNRKHWKRIYVEK